MVGSGKGHLFKRFIQMVNFHTELKVLLTNGGLHSVVHTLYIASQTITVHNADFSSRQRQNRSYAATNMPFTASDNQRFLQISLIVHLF